MNRKSKAVLSRDINETLCDEAISKLIEAFDCDFHSIKKITSAVLMYCSCSVAFAGTMLIFSDRLLQFQQNTCVI